MPKATEFTKGESLMNFKLKSKSTLVIELSRNLNRLKWGIQGVPSENNN